MTLFERIKLLAKKQGKSLNRVEDDLNLSRNYFYGLKKSNPASDKLELLADYFHVSVDYLLGRDDEEPSIPTDKELYRMILNGMGFRGAEPDDEDVEYMKGLLKLDYERRLKYKK